jgi:hypothetical protein
MRRLLVTKAYGIDIVLVAWNAQYGLAAFDVVNIYRVIASTRYNLSPVTGEAYRPDLSTSASVQRWMHGNLLRSMCESLGAGMCQYWQSREDLVLRRFLDR